MFKKILKYFSIGFAVIMLLLFLAGLLLTRFFGDDLKMMVEKEVNKQINTEFRITGKVHISLFRHFPNATISFEGLELESTLPEDSLLLMKAAKLSFTMNVLKLIRKDFSIHKVNLEDSEMNLLSNKQGKTNFDIFKSVASKGSDTNHKLAFQLHEADIKALHIRYTDKISGDLADLTIDKALLTGLFSAQNFDLNTQIQITSKRMQVANTQYLENESLKLSGHMLADLKNNQFSSEGFQLEMQDGAYVFSGSIKNIDHQNLLDINIKGSHLNVRSVMALMPESIHRNIAAWDSKGQLDLQANIKGSAANGRMPGIKATLRLSDATIYNYAYDQEFTDVELEASFNNGSSHSASASELIIKQMKARLDDEPFSLNIDLKNFDHPQIKGLVNASIKLDALKAFLAEAGLYQADGQIQFNNLAFTLKPDNIRQEKSVMIAGSGHIKFDDVDVLYAGKKIKNLNGSCTLDQSILTANDISAEINGSEIHWSGTLDRWMDQFFASSGDIPMEITGDMNTDELEIDELLTYYGASNEPSGQDAVEAPDYLSDFYLFSGTLNVNINTLSYEDFKADHISTKIALKPGTLAFHPLNAEIAKGLSRIDGAFSVEQDSLLLGRFHGDFNQVDISELFTQLHNFGQNYLTDQMLSGDLKTGLDIDLWFDKSLYLLQDKLKALADIKLQNGRLRNCETLEQLSSFVKVKELKDILFNGIENTIRIENSTVIIPAMILRSTALNLLLCGEHHFDNQIAYYFKINMLDVIARKFHFGKISIDESEQVREGLINLFVSMTGDAIDPEIETNKKLVKQRLYSDYYGLSDIREKIKQYNSESERIDWDNQGVNDTLEYINW